MRLPLPVIVVTGFTDEDKAAVRQVLIANGADSDPGLHASWRCFDKVRYPHPCSCIDEVVYEVLTAIAARAEAQS